MHRKYQINVLLIDDILHVLIKLYGEIQKLCMMLHVFQVCVSIVPNKCAITSTNFAYVLYMFSPRSLSHGQNYVLAK